MAAQAKDIHAALDRIAVTARQYPPQHPTVAKEPGLMILNGAYLVDDRCTDEFTARVDSLATEHRGVKLELTGPWPAYSFAGAGEEERP